MDVKIQNEIARLENVRDAHNASYICDVEILEQKIEKIESQINRAPSEIKHDILVKQKKYYENEISLRDKSIEQITKSINDKINTMKAYYNEWEKNNLLEKESIEHNIKKIEEYIDRGNTSDIFSALDAVKNALVILKKDLERVNAGTSSCTREQSEQTAFRA